MKLSERPLAFVDVETTGLDSSKHEIIEVAVVFDTSVVIRADASWANHLTIEGDIAYWTTRVKPERIEDAEPFALKINGYADKPQDWAYAPSAAWVSDILRELVTREGANPVLVGHNVSFDRDFLSNMLLRQGFTQHVAHNVVDTGALAYEHLVPCGLESLSLDAVRRILGMPTEGAHRALQDAKDARTVYHRLSRATSFDRAVWKFRNRK
jgi:DNA polymerase-3 subunit epsilon